MQKRELHTKHVATYLTESDFKDLEIVALEHNMSLSSYVRYILRKDIRRELSKLSSAKTG